MNDAIILLWTKGGPSLRNGIDALHAHLHRAPALRAQLMASHAMAEGGGPIAATAEVSHLIANHLLPADDPVFTDKDWTDTFAQNGAAPVTVATGGLHIPLT